MSREQASHAGLQKSELQRVVLCHSCCAVLYLTATSCAVLCAVLCRAVLCRALLCCAVLCCAVLCCALLCCAVLQWNCCLVRTFEK